MSSEGIKISSLKDLVLSTLNRHPRKKFTETVRQTDYPLIRLLMEKDAYGVDSGIGYEWDVRVRAASQFRFIRLFQVTDNNVEFVMAKASRPWARFEDKMLFDENEKAFNSGNEDALYDAIQTRESAWYDGMTEKMHLALLTPRQNAADDLGWDPIQWWMAPVAAGQVADTGGFVGTTSSYGDGTTTTSRDGIDSNDPLNARHRNFAHTWGGRIDEEYFKAIRRCITRTNFTFASDLKGETAKKTGRKVVLVGHEVMDDIEQYVNNNDPKGADPLRFTEDDAAARGLKFMRVPDFDALSNKPSIGINTKHLYVVKHKARWMKRQVWNHNGNPDVVLVRQSGTCQLVCDDLRRGGFHLHTPIAA